MLIDKYAPLYQQVNTKYQKSEVIAKIVMEVRKNSPGGGFVKKDFYSGRWFEIGDEKARDKVGKHSHHSNCSKRRAWTQGLRMIAKCNVAHAPTSFCDFTL
jgi:hypothetical protein